MKHFIILMMALVFTSCSKDSGGVMAEPPVKETINQQTDETVMKQKLNLTIDGKKCEASLVDNAATKGLIAALQQSDITYKADDYGGFEKVGALGRSLSTDTQQITTVPGDIMLYNGNQIVIFYGSNSWSYTRIGRIDNQTVESLKSFLKAGEGSVNVTLSLKENNQF